MRELPPRDLDTALRTMLRERADDITRVPAQLVELPREVRQPRRRWPVIAAAAAAVAIIAGGAAILRGDHSSSHNASAGTVCSTALPEQWRRALTDRLTPNGRDVDPLAAAPDGALVVSAQAASGGADLLLWRTDGSAKIFYHLPKYPGTDALGTVTTDGRYVLLPVEGNQGALADYPAGVIDTKDAGVTALLLVDSRTGSVIRLAGMTAADLKDAVNVIDGAALLDGHVYWDVRPHDNSRQGRIRNYDIAERSTTTIASGRIGSIPTLTARGVSWGSGGVRSTLFEQLTARLPRDAQNDVTDGSAFAYVRGRGLYWLSANGGSAGPFVPYSPGRPRLFAVTGPIVFLRPTGSGAHDLDVLDTRTGAVASLGLTDTGRDYAGGGVLAAVLQRNDNDYPIVRLDTARLPRLTC